MCGIAGIFYKTGQPATQPMLQRMADAVSHRGPDGAGIALFGPLGLAHRRLSILDLSEHGAQPMHYADSGLTIVHNGEIYNYIELRTELSARGYRFTSDSDTEVILAAYDAWGEDCVTRFNGMWAFAIHDAKRQQLFCSRDRFGVKPFYYLNTPEHFAFGSEIRQLLPLLPKVHANRAVLETFLITAASDLDAQSFFADIQKLPAGHSLTLDLATHAQRIHRHYQILHRPDIAVLSEFEAVEQLRALLTDAVKLRLRSDVTVGTCLSGGLDSSSVATLAAELYSGGKFAAITAVSEQASNNEAAFAEQVVNNSGLAWHCVTPNYDDFVRTLPSIVCTQEEPFGGPSVTMQYLVMQAARANNIPVLLDGQGGDEILLGYERYYATHILTTLREDGPAAAIATLRDILRNNANMTPRTIVKYFLGGISSTLRYGYYKQLHNYLHTTPPTPPHLKTIARQCGSSFDLQSTDVTSTNLPVLLRFEDKNSMAHSVETRLPFLDYRLVEFALSLPARYKINDGWTKWALRAAMDGKMHDSITWRKNKFGFEAPEKIWLTRHDPIMRDTILASPLLSEITDTAKLAQRYSSLDARSRFRLYSTALWESSFNVTLN